MLGCFGAVEVLDPDVEGADDRDAPVDVVQSRAESFRNMEANNPTRVVPRSSKVRTLTRAE